MKKEILNNINKNHEFIQSTDFNKDLLNKINYKFRLDWNYYSNHLEGGTLTKEETRSVMTDIIDVRGKSMKDVAEMRGHDHIITDIIKIGQGDNRILEKRIKDIHTAIMYEEIIKNRHKIGVWKTKPNHIINYKGEKNDFTKPENVAEELHNLLDKTNAKLDLFFADKKTEHPIIIATKFHIEFLSIHPFYDGNGRTARILSNLILISCGYPPIIIKNDVKDTYYKLLADIQVYGGNINLLENFLSERLLNSQQLILNALDGKDIEELDDVDKEINLFKKDFANKDEVIQKTDEVVYNTYKSSISPLLILFLKKHEQFEDLFVKKETLSLVNKDSSDRNNGFIFIDDWIMTHEKSWYFKNPNGGTEHFDNFKFEISFKGFKKDGLNTFDIHNSVFIEFTEFKYKVVYEFNFVEKLYSEILTELEIKQIVNASVKDLLKRIKSNIKKV